MNCCAIANHTRKHIEKFPHCDLVEGDHDNNIAMGERLRVKFMRKNGWRESDTIQLADCKNKMV